MSRFKHVNEILVFSQFFADIDSDVKLCLTLKIKFFDVKLCQTRLETQRVLHARFFFIFFNVFFFFFMIFLFGFIIYICTYNFLLLAFFIYLYFLACFLGNVPNSLMFQLNINNCFKRKKNDIIRHFLPDGRQNSIAWSPMQEVEIGPRSKRKSKDIKLRMPMTMMLLQCCCYLLQMLRSSSWCSLCSVHLSLEETSLLGPGPCLTS